VYLGSLSLCYLQNQFELIKYLWLEPGPPPLLPPR